MQKYQYFEWGSTLNLDGFKIIMFQYIICEPFRSWKEGLVKLDVNLWEIWRKFKCHRSISYPPANFDKFESALYMKSVSMPLMCRSACEFPRNTTYQLTIQVGLWCIVLQLFMSCSYQICRPYILSTFRKFSFIRNVFAKIVFPSNLHLESHHKSYLTSFVETPRIKPL